ncbi:MAG: hypothetical protein NXI04_11045 [Planctomycetaceae bacterium]|nr:hypothetical protein [Planctomycetaceae bacterium]
MKRFLTITILTICAGLSTAQSSQACMYIPWLDPFAWMGFYGCGYGGCGYNPCGYGGCNNYGVMPQVYAPQAPLYAAPQTLNYPVTPASPGCNCTSSAPQPTLTAVQVPVTTYRAVTQYVPQTTYRTQYRTVSPGAVSSTYGTYPSVPAYTAPRSAYSYGTAYTPYSTAIVTPSYAPPTFASPTLAQSYPVQSYPTQSYAPPTYASQTFSAPTIPSQVYPSPTPESFSTPSIPTPIASPVPGDIYGDHEYPTQSAVRPQPTARAYTPAVRQASWAQPATNRYPLSVR